MHFFCCLCYLFVKSLVVIFKICSEADIYTVAIYILDIYGLNKGHKCDMGFNIASACMVLITYDHLIA